MPECETCTKYQTLMKINWSDPRTVERLRKELMLHQQNEHRHGIDELLEWPKVELGALGRKGYGGSN